MDHREHHPPHSSSEKPVSDTPLADRYEDDFDMHLPEPGEERQGSRPGDRRYVIVRSTHPLLRRVRRGVLQATEEAEVPDERLARTSYWLKRLLIGVPLASERAEHERLSKFKALAVLSSDAISSVAFATEAILINLVAASLSSSSRYWAS